VALVRCSECGNQISSEAHACPSCGNPLQSKKKSGCGLFAVIAAIALTLGLVLIGVNDTSKKTASVQMPKVGDVWFVGDSTIGCVNQKALERIGELSRQGDKDAALTLLLASVSAGTCRLLQVNSTLYIETVGSSGPVCGRPRGELNCLWVTPLGISEHMFSVPAKPAPR
jgi:zinc-ribbon domain